VRLSSSCARSTAVTATASSPNCRSDATVRPLSPCSLSPASATIDEPSLAFGSLPFFRSPLLPRSSAKDRPMSAGVSYFGVRILRHVRRDLQDIAARGYTGVLHTFSVNDLAYYRGTLEDIVAASIDSVVVLP